MANHLSFDMLSRLVESRGSLAEEAVARRHMARCARCRSELEWLQRIQGVPGHVAEFEDSRGERDERSSYSLGVLRPV